MYKLHGIIPAMVTPFKEDKSLDEKGLQKLVVTLCKKGCHGILIGGTTGEYTFMDTEERKRLFELAVEAATGTETTILANTGCHGTKHTIELTQHAKNVGADAALILPTYYLKTNFAGLKMHYEMIAKNVDLPVVIYHYPDATGVLLSPEQIVELSKIDNIVGIKNTASMQHTSELLYQTQDIEDFNVLTGFEHLILSTLACGGEGAIGIVHNVVPEQLVEMYELVKEDKLNEAREINNNLIKLYDLMEEEPCPAPVKEALKQMGLPAGDPRNPVMPASDEFKEKLNKELKRLEVI